MEEPKSDRAMDKISYVELVQLVVAKRKILGYTLIVFLLGGILIAVTSPVEYESSAVTISESEEGGLDGLRQLGGLAGMAGINFPSENRSTFSPDLFPDVIQSRSFLKGLIEHSFFFETKGREMTLKEYYLEERPENILTKSFRFFISVPSRVLNLFSSSNEQASGLQAVESGDDLIRTTSSDEYVISQLRKRIIIEDNNRLLTLRVKAPEPIISAQLNDIVLKRLISYVTAYKTEKQRINLEFVESRAVEAEEQFKKAQFNLASFRDSNQGMVSQKAKSREEFLQAEFNIAFNVYNTLKQEEEQTKIQLKRETPIFTTLESAVVPLKSAEPKTALILILSLFLGLVTGLGFIVLLIVIDLFKLTFAKHE